MTTPVMGSYGWWQGRSWDDTMSWDFRMVKCFIHSMKGWHISAFGLTSGKCDSLTTFGLLFLTVYNVLVSGNMHGRSIHASEVHGRHMNIWAGNSTSQACHVTTIRDWPSFWSTKEPITNGCRLFGSTKNRYSAGATSLRNSAASLR